MNTETVLLGLILAGTGLCLGYFWVEITRRNQDRARLHSKRPTSWGALNGKADAEPTERALPRPAQRTDRQKAA